MTAAESPSTQQQDDRSTTDRPPADAPPPWHARPLEETRAALGSPANGLDSAEAATRLAQVGPNRLPEPPRPGALRRFLRQFHNRLCCTNWVLSALPLSPDGLILRAL